MTCTHSNFKELDIFDADGTIVVNRIKCLDCNMTNSIVYDVIEEDSIWDKITDRCRHGMYDILNYNKDGEYVRCDVLCIECGLRDSNHYKANGLSVCGWEDGILCANCELQEFTTCHHDHLTEKCVHCKHEDKDHYFDGKGECLICNCEGLET